MPQDVKNAFGDREIKGVFFTGYWFGDLGYSCLESWKPLKRLQTTINICNGYWCNGICTDNQSLNVIKVRK
jgi:hypothetical protein